MATPRPFFDTARDIRRGQMLEDCADKLQEVVAFWYELQRPDRTLEDAAKALIEKIKAESGASVVFGKPE